MANELTLNATLAYTKNNVSISESITNLAVTVGGNGQNALAAYSAPTAATALPLGSVAIPGGWLYIKNTDATNYVKVLTATAGTEFVRLLPGQFFLGPLAPGVTAPATSANTAACIVTFCVFDL